jgi:hypothetical protein
MRRGAAGMREVKDGLSAAGTPAGCSILLEQGVPGWSSPAGAGSSTPR